MTKINNLTDFLTDVADAIRTKTGTTDMINPQDFKSEIINIPSSSITNLQGIIYDKYYSAIAGTDRIEEVTIYGNVLHTHAFYGCDYLKTINIMSDLSEVYYMTNTFSRCYNLTTPIFCPNKVLTMSNTYSYCNRLTTAVCGPNVSRMEDTYKSCTNLTTAVCGPNVTNMHNTYYGCTNLTTAVCGDKVTHLNSTYYGCTNLTTAVCGPNVTNISYAYQNCTNLTTAVCGTNVDSMSQTYYGCTNLTTAVCGPNVNNMYATYSGCTNLTTAVCGPNVNNIAYTYNTCTNLTDALLYSNASSVNICGCFRSKNNSKRLNIYTGWVSPLYNSIITITNTRSIVGSSISWTNAGTHHYNTAYNIYVYPTTK